MDLSVILDNTALFDIYQRELSNMSYRNGALESPSKYHRLNRFINKAISSITYPMRFDDPKNNSNIVINHNLQELISCMVPSPRFQFMITSMAPFENRYGYNCLYRYDTQAIAESVLSPRNYFTKFCSVLYLHKFSSYKHK